eukprot:9611298-Lingulodinium_polyedra.AAC.1
MCIPKYLGYYEEVNNQQRVGNRAARSSLTNTAEEASGFRQRGMASLGLEARTMGARLAANA